MPKNKEKRKETQLQNDKVREQYCRIPMPPEQGDVLQDSTPKMSDLTWRIFRIMSEFVEGFQFLSTSRCEVTIFGSARFKPSNPWYKEAQKLGRLLGEHGFTVITGGGPGIMEAANRGAKEAGAPSIGLNIQLPLEQRTNPYVTRSRAFHYFFTRKVMLAASAQAYIYFPGGFGTLDEFFEIITLIQTGKMMEIPIVCVGKEYWDPLYEWIEMVQVKELKTVRASEAKLFTIVDTAEEVLEIVKYSKERSIF